VEVAVNSVPDQIVLRSEVEIIKSEGISQQVIDELDIGNEPEFRPEPAEHCSSSRTISGIS